MKTKYKILIVYLIVSYILGISLFINQDVIIPNYKEINISNPQVGVIGKGTYVTFIKDGIKYKAYSLTNGEQIKSGNRFVKSFQTLIHEYNYKKILNVHGVYIENKTANKAIFVKKLIILILMATMLLLKFQKIY